MTEHVLLTFLLFTKKKLFITSHRKMSGKIFYFVNIAGVSFFIFLTWKYTSELLQTIIFWIKPYWSLAVLMPQCLSSFVASEKITLLTMYLRV
jgi:hypothetical protein